MTRILALPPKSYPGTNSAAYEENVFITMTQGRTDHILVLLHSESTVSGPYYLIQANDKISGSGSLLKKSYLITVINLEKRKQLH